ncbi:MAG: 2-succinyl-6-hydroxy-2,4-cyclohexadiene-1-carboxylate synthase [Candidatus Hydrogenedentota bacterium]
MRRDKMVRMSSTAELFSRVWGVELDGAPVLFLHGFWGDSREWEPIAEHMASARPCHAVDLPGHGRTPWPDAGSAYGFPDVAADLARFLDDQGLGEAIVAGYSMGGRIALYFALEYPRRVAALVLESASPGLRSEAERPARRAWEAEWARALGTEPIDAVLERWYDQPLFASLRQTPGLLAELTARRREADPAGLTMAMRRLGAGAQPPLWDRLSELSPPTLAMAGENDRKYVDLAHAMAEIQPRLQARIVEGCGHNAHAEDPTGYARILREFVINTGVLRDESY